MIRTLDNLLSSINQKKDNFLRPLLVYIPKKLTPDMFSFSKFFLAALILIVSLIEFVSFLIISIIIFFFAKILDSIDGSLARIRRKVGKEGRLIDSLTDKILWIALAASFWIRYPQFYFLKIFMGIEIFIILLYISTFIFQNSKIFKFFKYIRREFEVSLVLIILSVALLEFLVWHH